LSRLKSFGENVRRLPRYMDTKIVSAGTVAAVMAFTGPLLIIITAAQNGGLTSIQTFSWLFAVYAFGGLLGIIMSLRYGMPIAGAFSIPSAVFLTQAITQFSFTELIGSYLIAGFVIFIIGIFGWFEKIMNWLPIEIVMAMIAGSMIHFAIDMLDSVVELPVIGAGTFLTYFLLARGFPKIPPVVGALTVGFVLFVLFGDFSMGNWDISYQLPSMWMPEFSWSAFFGVSVPIVIMLLGTECAQGISVLKNAGYKAPVNQITMASGIGTMVGSFFGGHSVCIAGIMSAMCSSDQVGPKEKRYAASFFNGLLMLGFGLLIPLVVGVILLLPKLLVVLIAGLALIGVLLTSFQKAFHGRRFQMGAFFSLVIAMSEISFWGISSTFWALVGGWVVSWVLEPHDFIRETTSADTETTKGWDEKAEG
jgi:benzoate membrane transport protein